MKFETRMQIWILIALCEGVMFFGSAFIYGLDKLMYVSALMFGLALIVMMGELFIWRKK